jgi:glycosyltransferase involved in cell wall biosynthesis
MNDIERIPLIMINNPFVSVCIPCYNGAKYIEECIDSILSQSHTDFELIIVDDQSSDNTIDIINKYNDSRISIHRNEVNLGLVGNWNRCIELANGEWIKFVFQDDILGSECIEKLLRKAIQGHKIVGCNRKFIYEGDISDNNRKFFSANKSTIEKLFARSTVLSSDEITVISLENLGFNFLGEPSVVLLHKSVFSHYGYFNKNLVQSCDLEFWTRVGCNAGVAFVPDELVSFRIHQGSVSAENWSNSKRSFRTSLDFQILLYEYLVNPLYKKLQEGAKVAGIDLYLIYLNETCMSRWVALKKLLNIFKHDKSLLLDVQFVTKLNKKIPVGFSIFIPWLIKYLAKRIATVIGRKIRLISLF